MIGNKILKLNIFTTIVTFIIIILYIYIPLAGLNPIIYELAYLISPFVPILGAIYVLRSYHIDNIHGKAFIFILLGAICMFLADVGTFMYSMIFEGFQYPYPSDFLYILGFIMILTGTIKEMINYKFFSEKIFKNTTLIMFIFFIILILLLSIIYNPDYSLSQNIANIIMRTGDFANLITVLGIFIMALGFKQGKLYIPWMIILVGIILTIVAGAISNIFLDQYLDKSGYMYLIDLFWVVGNITIGYGFFYLSFIIIDISQKILIKFKINLKNL